MKSIAVLLLLLASISTGFSAGLLLLLGRTGAGVMLLLSAAVTLAATWYWDRNRDRIQPLDLRSVLAPTGSVLEIRRTHGAMRTQVAMIFLIVLLASVCLLSPLSMPGTGLLACLLATMAAGYRLHSLLAIDNRLQLDTSGVNWPSIGLVPWSQIDGIRYHQASASRAGKPRRQAALVGAAHSRPATRLDARQLAAEIPIAQARTHSASE